MCQEKNQRIKIMAEAKKTQYIAAAEILEERIHYGDYLVNAIPSTRKLAKELKISHIVARKAIEKLLADGLCRQLENGRIVAAQGGFMQKDSMRRQTLAMLYPAFTSNYFQRCRMQLEQMAHKSGILFRPVNFVHWSDPVIAETVNNFDYVFLFGCAEKIEPGVVELLQTGAAKVTSVDMDLTSEGIPRIALFDASSIHPLLDHLKTRGAQRVGCLNTQPCDGDILRRIEAWKDYSHELDIVGPLYNFPVESYSDPTGHAYAKLLRLIPDLDCDALFCTTENAAYGASRALLDGGIVPGKDILLCAIGDCGMTRYFSPSITCVEMPDAAILFKRALQRMQEKAPEPCPITYSPESVPLFIGESTSRQSELSIRNINHNRQKQRTKQNAQLFSTTQVFTIQNFHAYRTPRCYSHHRNSCQHAPSCPCTLR
eukprot:TRINITY_DN3839_c0_g1_i3.p1 TRINITY_DN3839_c0_g1~~TRINITY_DN3839_c0_g1_i3.p1  ORF type:complete len:429 (+),score=55.62 TRINITY_DN3839_c0_g1_i3:221-1507(+)